MLNMIQKVFYGNANALTANGHDIRANEKIILAVIVILICCGRLPATDIRTDKRNCGCYPFKNDLQTITRKTKRRYECNYNIGGLGAVMMFSGIIFKKNLSVRICAIIGLLLLLAGDIAEMRGNLLFDINTH